jgi:hypothetical protein
MGKPTNHTALGMIIIMNLKVSTSHIVMIIITIPIIATATKKVNQIMNNSNAASARALVYTESIKGMRKLIKKCWKIVNDPNTEESDRIEALRLAKDCNVNIAQILIDMRREYLTYGMMKFESNKEDDGIYGP